MVNGTELDAYILSRDTFATDGKPGVTKLAIPSGTAKGSVEFPNLPTVTSIRNTNPYEGVYQIVAFQNSSAAAVLFMADQTDGQVAIVNTSTMAVSSTVPVSELPFALTPDETGTTPVLWVSYILAIGWRTCRTSERSRSSVFSLLRTPRPRAPAQQASWTAAVSPPR